MNRSVDRQRLPELQALRALAVALVVIYHVWPKRVPGGFIGVDVFFVISGFLITAHLLREYVRTGSIRLSAFWARRIRRLLPAALTVLAACVLLAFAVLPAVVRDETLKQASVASAYGLNWLLGFEAVDYLAAGTTATVVQHYWTLSVEEQFYVGWPVILVVIGIVATWVRRLPNNPILIFGGAAVVVIVASFGYSVYLTWVNPELAYFSSGTRAWEFAAGGLLAILVARWPTVFNRIREHRLVRSAPLPTLAGGALIVASALMLDGGSPFPGHLAAVPVIGTLLVIVGGMPSGLWVGRVLELKPIQFVGDISYSLYLWHWPVITTFVLLLGRRPDILEGVGLVGASLFLATVTKVLIEDPARASRLFVGRIAPAFVLAGLGVLAFTGVWAGSSAVVQYQTAQEREIIDEQVSDTSGCFGANAMIGSGACPDPFALGPSVDLTAAAYDLDYQNWCLASLDEEWKSCEFGDPEGTRTIALVGDSHAASMVAAFDEYFATRDVTVVTFLRNGCSGLNIGTEGSDDPTEEGMSEFACRVWSNRVRAELIERSDIDTVVYLNRTSIYVSADRPEPYRLTPDDIVSTWEGVLDSGKRVISIKDWPRTAGESIPVCLSAHSDVAAPCSVSLTFGVPPDPQDEARRALGDRVDRIDLTDAFCDADTCYSVIGGVVVYADSNHLAGTYARTLMPFLGPNLLE